MRSDELQKALYTKLNGDVTLSAMLVGVYAHVEEVDDGEDTSLFPYVTLGPETSVPFDTKTNYGMEALVQVDIWSRQKDYVETKQIAERVYELLHHQPLVIETVDHVMTVLESASYVLDPDGVTRHGMQSFRVVYDNI